MSGVATFWALFGQSQKSRGCPKTLRSAQKIGLPKQSPAGAEAPLFSGRLGTTEVVAFQKISDHLCGGHHQASGSIDSGPALGGVFLVRIKGKAFVDFVVGAVWAQEAFVK